MKLQRVESSTLDDASAGSGGEKGGFSFARPPFIPHHLFPPRLLLTVTAGHGEGDKHRSEAAEGDDIHTKPRSYILNTARKVIPAGRGLNRGHIVGDLSHVNSHDVM